MSNRPDKHTSGPLNKEQGYFHYMGGAVQTLGHRTNHPRQPAKLGPDRSVADLSPEVYKQSEYGG